jgi:acyl-coenzyme A thioesterase PaaI-like protein
VDEATLLADGWERLALGGFSLAIGQTWRRGAQGARTLAVLAHPGIVNDYGVVVHGGALMTFADIALGQGAADAITGHSYATVQLQYQFAGAARAGSLITCTPELVRRTSQLAFVRGLILADGETIGSAEGLFKAFKPKG